MFEKKIFFASFLKMGLVQKKMMELRLEFIIAIVPLQDCTVLNVATAPNCCAVNVMVIETGRKLNTKTSTIVKHVFASFISLSLFLLFFVVDASSVIAFGGVSEGSGVLAARKILI